jgi:hypothetical protein
VHAAIDGQTGQVDYTLKGTTAPVKGSFVRSSSTARVGRRGQTTVMHERTTDFVAAALPDNAGELVLSDVQGRLNGAIEVQVFRDWWPLPIEAPLMLVVLIGLVVLAARAKADASLLSAGAVALSFGVCVYQFASPERAVRPEIGALILALLAGGTLGGMLAWLAKKLTTVVSAR